MILIINRQKKIKLNINLIKSNIKKILDFLGYSNFDIGIYFTTNNTIKKYNKKYRDKNKYTDILSFPYHDNLKPGQKISIKDIEDKNLGDIIISLEHAKKDSQEQNINFQEYIFILLIHGISHLLNYDHKTEKDFKIMKKFEKSLLSQINT
jgi:probable rRNA maturation factor